MLLTGWLDPGGRTGYALVATVDEELEDHPYFKAVEEIFLELRGSPLTLQPSDWHQAARWNQEGIPLDLVREVLAEVFAKRKKRGVKRKVSSLEYCAPAVEKAWRQRQELTGPGRREEAPPFDAGERLRALAAALPENLPGRAELAARMTGLAGDPQAIEEDLARMDREMLTAAAATLGPGPQAEIGTAVMSTLESLSGRLPPEELERSRERLTLQVLRQRLGLPMLSLFSPDAEGEGGGSAPSDRP